MRGASGFSSTFPVRSKDRRNRRATISQRAAGHFDTRRRVFSVKVTRVCHKTQFASLSQKREFLGYDGYHPSLW